MQTKFIQLNIIPENCAIIAPDEFTALLVGYSEAIDKPLSAAVLVEREVLLSLIQRWLDDHENRKRLCLIRNLGE